LQIYGQCTRFRALLTGALFPLLFLLEVSVEKEKVAMTILTGQMINIWEKEKEKEEVKKGKEAARGCRGSTSIQMIIGEEHDYFAYLLLVQNLDTILSLFGQSDGMKNMKN
jgi:hypothetical protein